MKYLVVLLGACTATVAHAYPNGSPPAHTGGFGEPNCHACHFDGPLVQDNDALEITGLPSRFEAGRTYELTLVLGTPSTAAGFQLSARDRVGRQAGTLVPVDDRTGVMLDGEVRYLGHTQEGLHTEGRWTFIWEAPDDVHLVLFNVAANAANDDRSEFGDRIMLFEALTAMERR